MWTKGPCDKCAILSSEESVREWPSLFLLISPKENVNVNTCSTGQPPVNEPRVNQKLRPGAG